MCFRSSSGRLSTAAQRIGYIDKSTEIVQNETQKKREWIKVLPKQKTFSMSVTGNILKPKAFLSCTGARHKDVLRPIQGKMILMKAHNSIS